VPPNQPAPPIQRHPDKTSRGFRSRHWTLVCVLAAVVCVGVAVVYLVTPADALPALLPGHGAGSTQHHIKHALAFLALAAVAAVGAWFTTGPTTSRPDDDRSA
jgi:membrane protein DedA with SNARE-associated domain